MNYEYEKVTTLPQLLTFVSKTAPNQKAFSYKEAHEWKHISTEEFALRVAQLSKILNEHGIKKNDTVGILSPSSPFWLMSDFAISTIGAISVPFFVNESEEHIRYKIKDANLKGIFVLSDYEQKYNERFIKIIEPLANSFSLIITKNIRLSKSIDFDSKGLKGGDRLLETTPKANADTPSKEELPRPPTASTPSKEGELRGEYLLSYSPSLEGVDAVGGRGSLENDIATIIYTSGSTGEPKGVELTHKNFIAQVRSITKLFSDLSPKDNVLSFLPIAHSFERTLMYFYISRGASIYFCPDISQIAECLREVEPTFMTTVPRLLEKMHAKIIEKSKTGSWIKRKIAKWALERALTKPKNALADLFVYKKIQKLFGRKLKYLVSGGSPLPAYIYKFFVNIGIPLYQGYGLTEATPVITANFVGRNKVGTVGPALPDVEIKLTSRGEVLARGDNIMKGYHNRAEETRTVIDTEGWLHTGDTGTIDNDGFLTITGRIKELYKTSGGKYVSPVPLEDKLKKNTLIDMAMIIADGKPCVTALLFIDPQKNTPSLESDLNEYIKRVNEHLNDWEQIRNWRIIFDIPTVEEGELTPTLKLRRKVIEEKYRKVIEEMYNERANRNY